MRFRQTPLVLAVTMRKRYTMLPLWIHPKAKVGLRHGKQRVVSSRASRGAQTQLHRAVATRAAQVVHQIARAPPATLRLSAKPRSTTPSATYGAADTAGQPPGIE